MRYHIFILLFVASSLIVKGQDYIADYKKVSEKFRTANINAKITVFLYNKIDGTPEKVGTGYIKKLGNEFSKSKYNSVEQIKNRDKFLVIDHESLEIDLYAYDQKVFDKVSTNKMLPDSILTKYLQNFDYSYEKLSDGSKKYTFNLLKPSDANNSTEGSFFYFSSIEVIIKNDFLITINYIYNPNLVKEIGGEKLSVKYNYLSETVRKNEFSLNSYVIKKGSTYILTPMFKNYSLSIYSETYETIE